MGQKPIEGSNPSLSAIYRKGSAKGGAFFVSYEEIGQMKRAVRSTKGSTNSPGANLNERSEPEGQGTGMYPVIPLSPPYSLGCEPDTWFTLYTGDIVNTLSPAKGLGAGSTQPFSIYTPTRMRVICRQTRDG